MGKWAAAAGDAPGGAEDEAEDERAQGARIGERHRMRERILHGDVDHSHASDHVPSVVRVDPRQMSCWTVVGVTRSGNRGQGLGSRFLTAPSEPRASPREWEKR